ncbi:hypothetical protein CALCODRAFT_512428 [Calocera cornea HHB12733]|uniref:Uncharacterized protein n=1 Tax=Calocera cornea HHB12733 TaxID=1353952 RepID=A0A165D1K8_9BASI|nr:hypothetical protein CALCODRAFT_512428 [Calocera cornea HHB12733]
MSNIAMGRSQSETKTTVLLIVLCNLHSPSHMISVHADLTPTIKTMEGVTTLREYHSSTVAPRRYQDGVPLDLSEAHDATVVDLRRFMDGMQTLKGSCPPPKRCTFQCDIRGTVSIQRRPKTTALGRVLVSNFDVVSQIADIGKLSLRDIQHLAAASKTVAISPAYEVKHRLRTALSPYFPGALAELSGLLRKHRAIISGSTVLSILVPGPWKPNDLDIVLPETSAYAIEAFLGTHGYVRDPRRQRELLDDYPIDNGPILWDYGCFKKEALKIDLCYISTPATPVSHVMNYHSTAVMNYFDGRAVYCLFPDETFSRQYHENDYYPGRDDVKMVGLHKLEERGFAHGRFWLTDVVDGYTWDENGLFKVINHVIWRQLVDL